MTDIMKGKVAAITGSASGIGLECARTLLAEGAKVVLIDRAKDRLAQLCAQPLEPVLRTVDQNDLRAFLDQHARALEANTRCCTRDGGNLSLDGFRH